MHDERKLLLRHVLDCGYKHSCVNGFIVSRAELRRNTLNAFFNVYNNNNEGNKPHFVAAG